MPPWPGKQVPESFTPAALFTKDSTKSPKIATSPIL